MAVTSLNSVLSRMTKLSEETVDRTFLGLLYGASGVGKTSLAAWLAQELRTDEGRVLLIDSGEGYVSLEENDFLEANVDRIAFQEYGDLIVTAEAIGTTKVGGRFKNIEVVIIDELDPMSDAVLDRVVRDAKGTPDDQVTPEIEGKDHKPMADLMMTAINAFRRKGVHVILVAHDNVVKKGQSEQIISALSPKYRARVNQLMHVVAFCSGTIKLKGGYSRQVQAVPSSGVEAKARIPALRDKVTFEHDEFVAIVSSWIKGDSYASDIEAPEDHEPVEDTTDPEDVAEGATDEADQTSDGIVIEDADNA